MPATTENLERFGPFILLKPLGAGGMGTAFLAVHPDTENLLVVKRMHPELVREPTLFRRFVHEAEVASHVKHPNVAALVAMGTVDGEPFLATEFVFGIQASQIVSRIQMSAVDPLPLQVGLRMGIEIAAGLEAVHSAGHRETGEPLGLVHRDVGARNVLVGFDGRVRLIDLGLGKSILADWQTSAEILAGSPDYMPPEQALGSVVDARADVYAATVAIWELLVGVKRIREDSVAARVKRAVIATPEALVDRRADAPRSLEKLLQRGMHPDLDRRLADATELRMGLEAEARRIGGAREDAVRAWLDSACATIIARQRRTIQELRSAVSSIDRSGSQVQLFVGDVESWAPAEVAVRVHSESRPIWLQLLDRVRRQVEGRILLPLANLTDPAWVTSASFTELFGVVAMFVAIVSLTAGLTVWWLLPGEVPSRVQTIAPTPQHPTAVTTRPDETPPPAAGLSTKSFDARDDLAAHPRARPMEPSGPISADLQPEKEALLVRVKQLRKVKYEIQWQRRLTAISARLSRARTRRTLSQIEAALTELEKAP